MRERVESFGRATRRRREGRQEQAEERTPPALGNEGRGAPGLSGAGTAGMARAAASAGLGAGHARQHGHWQMHSHSQVWRFTQELKQPGQLHPCRHCWNVQPPP